MHARIVSLAIALLALGCDQVEDPPADGSCRAMARELKGVEDCQFSIEDGIPRDVAGCAVELFGLPEPHPCDDEVSVCDAGQATCDQIFAECQAEGVNDSEAYQVAYAALCAVHGQTASDFCTISEHLGCEG